MTILFIINMSYGQKVQFFKPSEAQQRQMIFSNLRTRINHNQEHILQLLNKYREVIPEEPSPKQKKRSGQKSLKSSRNRKQSPSINESARKQVNLRQRAKQPLLKLPKVGQKNRIKPQNFVMHKSRSFMDNYTKHPYSTILKDDARNKKRVNKSVFDKYKTIDLQNIGKNESRFQQKQAFLNQQNDFQQYFMRQMVLKMDKDIEEEVQNSDIIYDMNLGLNKPLQYRRPQPKKNQNNDSQSSNQQAQVPITYYQKQLKETLQKQSLDQLNFLYFSKNEAMKDWTQQLFSMFEKHNKETEYIKKKCKFLETFDQSFFTADVYREK